MPCQDAASPCPVLLEKQKVHCGHPPQRTRPVTNECQNSNGCNIVTANAVIRVGEVDRGDGVGAPKGEEGGELENYRSQREIAGRQIQSA